MILNSIVKILKINREGVSDNGVAYVHCSAISYDKNEQFIMVRAFGSNADYILRNFNDSPRRAMVTGNLTIDAYEEDTDIIKTVSFKGEKKKIKFTVVQEKISIGVNVLTLQFLDKKRDDDAEIVDEDCEEDYEILECEDEEREETTEIEVEINDEDVEKPRKTKNNRTSSTKTRTSSSDKPTRRGK